MYFNKKSGTNIKDIDVINGQNEVPPISKDLLVFMCKLKSDQSIEIGSFKLKTTLIRKCAIVVNNLLNGWLVNTRFNIEYTFGKPQVAHLFFIVFFWIFIFSEDPYIC